MILTAIVFFKPGTMLNPTKYRNIKGFEKFERFAMSKFADKLQAINFYDKETKRFIKQVKLK
jgi:hypothetical protein